MNHVKSLCLLFLRDYVLSHVNLRFRICEIATSGIKASSMDKTLMCMDGARWSSSGFTLACWGARVEGARFLLFLGVLTFMHQRLGSFWMGVLLWYCPSCTLSFQDQCSSKCWYEELFYSYGMKNCFMVWSEGCFIKGIF